MYNSHAGVIKKGIKGERHSLLQKKSSKGIADSYIDVCVYFCVSVSVCVRGMLYT